LHLFHQAFVQCVRTGTGALTRLWLRDGIDCIWQDTTQQDTTKVTDVYSHL